MRDLRNLSYLIGYLSAEVQYRKDILCEVFARVGRKSKPPFRDWMYGLSKQLEQGEMIFADLWGQNIKGLYEQSGLKQEDLEYLEYLGQVLGYLDVETQIAALSRLQKELETKVDMLSGRMRESVRVSFVLGITGGFLLVMILL